MRKINEENERVKRAYLDYLKQADGLDEASIDKAAAGILMFEESTGFKSFKSWHRDQAGRFKSFLDKRRNKRTGKPLGLSTRDATLRLVQKFFRWLAGQPGYKSRISYADAAYFNNNMKDARAARAPSDAPIPTMAQCAHAFQAMPERTDIEKRDKAMVALLMLTGARDSALATLRIKHINLFDGRVFQDGREVRTKNAKTIVTWFFPVDDIYRTYFEGWMRHLRETLLFGSQDPVFPQPEMGNRDGKFAVLGLSRERYDDGSKVREVVRSAFAAVQLPEYTPHAFRKTLMLYGDEVCDTMQQRKAWSMNLGHEHIATSINSYLPVSPDRQGELIKQVGEWKAG